MILSVLIFNNHGLPRLSKFYTPTPPVDQRKLIHSIYSLVESRPPGLCSFLDAPELREGFFGGKGKEKEGDGRDVRVIYRQFATLTFVFLCDSAESELGVLDLIQVFVEALDKVFENVCELDLVFGFDEVHHTLAEIIQGGLVLETNISIISQNVTSKAVLRQQSKDSIPSLASLSTAGRGRGRPPPSSHNGGVLGTGLSPLGGVGGTAVAEWAVGLVGGWGSRRA